MLSTRAKKGGTAAPVVVEEEEEEDESPPRPNRDRAGWLDRVAAGSPMDIVAAFKAVSAAHPRGQQPNFVRRVAAAAVQPILPLPVPAMVEAPNLRSSKRPPPPDKVRHYAVQYCLLRILP